MLTLKTAAEVLDTCGRKAACEDTLASKANPRLLLEGADVAVEGVTYVFAPSKRSQGACQQLNGI